MRGNMLLTAVASAVILTTLSPAQAQVARDTQPRACVRVIVPSPDAILRLDDTVMPQRGTTRLFLTPPLENGKTYSYMITASWLDNGRRVTQQRKVRFRAGQQAQVDFTVAEATPERPLRPRIAPETGGQTPPERPPIAPPGGREGPADDRPLTPPVAREPQTNG